MDPRPMVLSLAQNKPNPFKGVTEIRYGLPEACRVKLTVYDLMGREVRRLVDEHEAAGYRVVRWDGRNDIGHQASGGVYFYRLEAGTHSEMRKMVYLR